MSQQRKETGGRSVPGKEGPFLGKENMVKQAGKLKPKARCAYVYADLEVIVNLKGKQN